MDYSEVKREVWAHAVGLWKSGINAASSGNLSMRVPMSELCAITPSGVRYDTLQWEQIVIVDLDGNIVEGGKPSVETPMHTLLYKLRPDVGAIAHTHSAYTIALAAVGESLPMISVEGLCAGNAVVPVTEHFYGPGTQEFADEVAHTLKAHPGLCAVLLRNHGLLSMGKALKDAVGLAESLEVEAHAYLLARSIGTPHTLSEETRRGILAYGAGKQDSRA